MEYKVEITYKRIKNLHLRVKDNIVKVSAPFLVSKERINRFINDNIDFINKQLTKQQEVLEKKTIKYNDTITILSNLYQVLPTSSKSKVTDHFIFIKNGSDINKTIKRLFKEKLYKKMYDITFYYFNNMNLNVSFPNIVIKDVKSKWGSYSKSKHEIIYSSNILFKDEIVFLYLVVHELAHILQYNHSKKFYEIVEKYCPNYKKLRKLLKEW